MRKKGLGGIVNNLAIIAISAAFVVPAVLAYEGIKLLTKDKTDEDAVPGSKDNEENEKSKTS